MIQGPNPGIKPRDTGIKPRDSGPDLKIQGPNLGTQGLVGLVVVTISRHQWDKLMKQEGL